MTVIGCVSRLSLLSVLCILSRSLAVHSVRADAPHCEAHSVFVPRMDPVEDRKKGEAATAASERNAATLMNQMSARLRAVRITTRHWHPLLVLLFFLASCDSHAHHPTST